MATLTANNSNRFHPLNLQQTLTTLIDNAWFSYGTIFLLQLKVIWNIWQYRDLTLGDTSAYFVNGLNWAVQLRTSFAWTPLYTAFYGTLFRLTGDAYTATILHRMIIVLALAILVLMLMRRLLPTSLAWLMAAWWVILPINFDALYEVHLFAAIPALMACIIAAGKPSVWMRGLTLGIFVLAAVLVRNELAIATSLWVVICMAVEVRKIREKEGHAPLRYALAYGLPVLVAGVIIVFFYARSTEQGATLSGMFQAKHTLNVCQIYAFNYQQQFQDWQLDPWTQCHDLMQRDFGVPEPSMMEAIRLNPTAMLRYFLWNVRLIPQGLQVLLFNGTFGNLNPDYLPVALRYQPAIPFSIMTIVILVAGLVLLWRRRGQLWETWLNTRYLGWLALLCTALTVSVVIIMQRPRPSYMFNLSFLIMALVGMGLYAIVTRLNGLKLLTAIMPVVIAGLLLLTPRFYTRPSDMMRGYNGRPMAESYERLKPLAASFTGQVFFTWNYPLVLSNYLSDGLSPPAQIVSYSDYNSSGMVFADWLEAQSVDLIYADEWLIAQPSFKAFMAQIDTTVWETIASYQQSGYSWQLLRRR